MIKRNDGTYEITKNGLPYHVTENDQLFAQCQADEITNGADQEPPTPIDPLTPEQKATMKRRAAYSTTDAMKMEIEFDAWSKGKTPDYTPWIEAVQAVKVKYPK